MSPELTFAKKKYRKFLLKNGWTEDRNVPLPTCYQRYEMSDKATKIITNLHGLTFKETCNHCHYDRTFLISDIECDSFADHLQEANEDYQLTLNLYPLGELSELAGYFAIDDNGNYYLLRGELLFIGSSLYEFMDAFVFSAKACIFIDYPDSPNDKYKPGTEQYLSLGLRRTFYGNNGSATEWLYDKSVGLVPYPAT